MEDAKDGMVRIEMWVPADVADDAREAVQNVVDDYNRPPQPLPCWAAPVVSGFSKAWSANKAADAQTRAARGEVSWQDDRGLDAKP